MDLQSHDRQTRRMEVVATRRVSKWSVRAMLSRIALIVVVGFCTGTTWAATFTLAVVDDGGRPGAAD